jgi:hypothetical protein
MRWASCLRGRLTMCTSTRHLPTLLSNGFQRGYGFDTDAIFNVFTVVGIELAVPKFLSTSFVNKMHGIWEIWSEEMAFS